MKIYHVTVNANTVLITEDYSQANASAEGAMEDINDTVIIETWDNGQKINTEVVDDDAERIYVAVGWGDNGEKYKEELETASENLYVGTNKKRAINVVNEATELPASGFEVTCRYIETWRNDCLVLTEELR